MKSSVVQISFHDKETNNTQSCDHQLTTPQSDAPTDTTAQECAEGPSSASNSLGATISTSPHGALSSQALSWELGERAPPPGSRSGTLRRAQAAPTDQLNLPVALHVVEGDGYPGRLPVQHGELTSVRFPGEGDDGF